LPDEAKVAKIILKDLVNGKVLCCTLPPEYDHEKYKDIITYNNIPKTETDKKEIEKIEEKKNEDDAEELNDEELIENKQKVDVEFFDDQDVIEDPFEGLDNEDILLLLLEGKSIAGYKLTKQQRRDFKFALKRGEVMKYRNLCNEIEN
jgi:hypothetical protein